MCNSEVARVDTLNVWIFTHSHFRYLNNRGMQESIGFISGIHLVKSPLESVWKGEAKLER